MLALNSIALIKISSYRTSRCSFHFIQSTFLRLRFVLLVIIWTAKARDRKKEINKRWSERLSSRRRADNDNRCSLSKTKACFSSGTWEILVLLFFVSLFWLLHVFYIYLFIYFLPQIYLRWTCVPSVFDPSYNYAQIKTLCELSLVVLSCGCIASVTIAVWGRGLFLVFSSRE